MGCCKYFIFRYLQQPIHNQQRKDIEKRKKANRKSKIKFSLIGRETVIMGIRTNGVIETVDILKNGEL